MDAIARANGLLGKGKHGEALRLYRKAAGQPGHEERARCGMVISLLMGKKLKEAAECASDLADLLPKEAYPLGVLGSILEIMDRPLEAMDCYDRMVKMDPGEIAARFKKALLLFADDRDEEGERCLKEALKAQTFSPAAQDAQDLLQDIAEGEDLGEDEEMDSMLLVPGMSELFGVLLPEAGLLDSDDDGLAALLGAAGVPVQLQTGGPGEAGGPDPLREEINEISAEAMELAEAGRYAEALECIESVIEIKPDSAANLGVKGMMLEKLGRADEALECYDAILRAEPGEMLAHHLKCGLLAAAGDARGALKCYRAALKAEPSDLAGAGLKGQIRYEYGELSRCVKESGSQESGLAKFMRKYGVASQPMWGRRKKTKRAGARPRGNTWEPKKPERARRRA